METVNMSHLDFKKNSVIRKKIKMQIQIILID